MKKLKLGLLTLIMAGAMFALSGCGANKVNLNDYAVVKFSGYDGFGTPTLTLDAEKLKEDVGDANAVAAIEAAVSGSFETTTGLSNGDDVEYTWRVSETAEDSIKEKYGFKLKYKDFSSEVEGLKDPAEFDAADILDIQVEGTSPEGTIKVESTIPQFKVTVDKTEGLSNGDIVNIKFELNSPDSFEVTCANNNVPVFDPDYQYTVSGLWEPVSSIEEINDSVKNTIKERIEQKLQDYENSNDKWYEIDGAEYLGSALISTPDGNLLVEFYSKHYIKPSDVTIYTYRAYKNVDNRPELTEDNDYEEITYSGSYYDSRANLYWGSDSLEEVQQRLAEAYNLTEPITLIQF